MKLLSYRYNNEESYGVLSQDQKGIIDLKKRLGSQYQDIRSLLTEHAQEQVKPLLQLPADLTLDQIEFLPVIPNPNKIICAGMNYEGKKREFNYVNQDPVLFIRFADSQTGHQQPLVKPDRTEQFDFEGEIAVIIGKTCFRLTEQEALGCVAGYSCYMDGSARDWQFTWHTAGKNWPKTGGFGPWMTTSDEITDPCNLAITTRLNGVVMQSDNTANLIYTIPQLLVYITTFTALSPGDVILTGSPEGTGKHRNPPLFLQKGDVLEVTVDKIGTLINRVE